jgi:hypothetical protein
MRLVLALLFLCFPGLKLSHMGLKNACYRIFVSSPYDVALRQWEKQKSADR